VVPVGLCEREGELARVDALLDAARAGRGGVLLITGPAGIGKTMLLGAARERAGQAGMRVLAGRGGELEGGFSFGVVRQVPIGRRCGSCSTWLTGWPGCRSP
jgi:predicted ATPase